MLADGRENLIPVNERSKEEARLISQKGGINSGKTRQKRKTMREAYLAIAGRPYVPMGEMAEQIVNEYGKITVDEAIMIAQSVKAANGDTQAAAFIRDTIGEKQVEIIDNKVTISMGKLSDYAK